MKAVYLFFLLLLNTLISYTQTDLAVQIKRQFDSLSSDFIDRVYSPCSISVENIPYIYGDGMSYILEAYLNLYETTHEKDYLIKFINYAICMQENRQDVRGISPNPRWTIDPMMYHDGLICWPMSHFCYLILTQDSLLSAQALPMNATAKYYNNTFNLRFKTYGDVAIWLKNKTIETMDWYTFPSAKNGYKTYWGDNKRCYTPNQNPGRTTRAQAVNMQAGFACALYYLSQTDLHFNGFEKACAIASAYKGNYILKKALIPPNFLLTRKKIPVLQLTNKNAYLWGTNGWRAIPPKEEKGGLNAYEDISHGIQSLFYPLLIQNKLKMNGKFIIDSLDMLRFRNTFVYHVYAGDSLGVPQFHSDIDGDDFVKYDQRFNGINRFDIRCLTWMPLHQFDKDASTTPQLFDIVMRFYTKKVATNEVKITTGMDFLGLAYVVAAQWKKVN